MFEGQRGRVRRGELRGPLLDILGREGADRWTVMREAMIAALDAGAFRPTHFRAVKPGLP